MSGTPVLCVINVPMLKQYRKYGKTPKAQNKAFLLQLKRMFTGWIEKSATFGVKLFWATMHYKMSRSENMLKLWINKRQI